jgi:exopolysaccharide biosynthesis polyprenyl glycosylphosphotransferase
MNEYYDAGIWLLVLHFVTVFYKKPYKSILRRGVADEIQSVVTHNMIMYILFILYLFMIKHTGFFSRTVFSICAILSLVLMFLVRSIWKKILLKRYECAEALPHLYVVTATEQMAEDFMRSFEEKGFRGYHLKGFVLNGAFRTQQIMGVPVFKNREDFLEYARVHVVDEVMVYIRHPDDTTLDFTYQLMTMGITVHFNLEGIIERLPEGRIGRMGGFTVMTSSLKFASDLELALKRVMDICGALVGLLITGILFIFVAPVIYLQSPGPIFFSQERVGKNGRKFKIYKFRSMYMDAEERKKELMEQNKMQGLMFKMDNDPRIFPFGHFLRKTSIDEFPQFFNILKGDMSLVGTRPPTVDEYEQYEFRHKVRLSIKPGLTGMWQVSGRSDITDFDEVVALDEKYVSEWSIWLDIKILFKTVKVVLMSKGAE